MISLTNVYLVYLSGYDDIWIIGIASSENEAFKLAKNSGDINNNELCIDLYTLNSLSNPEGIYRSDIKFNIGKIYNDREE